MFIAHIYLKFFLFASLQTFALPLEEVQAQVVLYCLLLFGIGVIALISNTLGVSKNPPPLKIPLHQCVLALYAHCSHNLELTNMVLERVYCFTSSVMATYIHGF